MLIVDIILVIVSVFMLWYGAEKVVESSARIAAHFGISELIIGLTVVSIGTSAPEFAVTITAAFKGYSNISVGNIVGSNIFNLGFILGGVALAHPVIISKKLIHRDGLFLFGCTILLLIFFINKEMGRLEGVILLILLVIYLTVLFTKGESTEEKFDSGPATFKDAPLLLLGIILIIAGGHFLVDSASGLAREMGVSEWVIGVTIVAAGTSMPEFVTSLVAILRGHHGISVGNLIGSDIFNVVGVLGLAGVLRNLRVDSAAYSSLIMLTIMVLIVLFFMRTQWKLTRWEGAVLIALGMIRWIIDYAT